MDAKREAQSNAMNTFKGRGIVLRELEVGESDKLVTLLLKERGKVTVSARGARKPKSKFMAGTQLFTYSDFVLRDGKTFFSLAQVDVIESFYPIRSDYDKLCHASCFLELTGKILMENMGCDEILLLLLKSLTALQTGRLDNRLVACVFEFKFMQYNGLAPETTHCGCCEGELTEPVFFGEEGCVCRRCRTESRHWTSLSAGALRALRYILGTELANLFRFTVSEAVLRELEHASALYLRTHFDVSLKSKTLLLPQGL